MLLTFTPIAQPDASYLAATTKLSSAAADGTNGISSVTDGAQTVSFSTTMIVVTTTHWGQPPQVESSTPRLFSPDNGTAGSYTLSFTTPVKLFGVELSQDYFNTTDTLHAVFYDGATQVGSIDQSVTMTQSPAPPNGAKLFAAETDGQFTHVVVSKTGTNSGPLDMAQLRYSPAAPTVFTWDGGGADANWTTAANWDGDVAPTPGSSLVFPDGAARLTNTNDFAPGTAFHDLTIESSGYAVSGNAIGLDGAITASFPGASSTLSLPVQLLAPLTIDVTGGGTLLNQGNFSGSGFGLTKAGPGTVVLFGTGTEAALSGGLDVDGGTVHVVSDDALPAGAVSLAAGTTLLIDGATTIDNAVALDGGATIDARAAATLSGRLSGAGTLTKAGAGALTLTNDGNEAAATGGVVVGGGALSASHDDALPAGPISLAEGTTLAITGEVVPADAIEYDNAVTLTGAATIRLAAGFAELSGLLSGADTLTFEYSTVAMGYLALSNPGNEAAFTGGLIVTGGAILATSDDALPAGTITLKRGTILGAGDGETIDNAVVLDGDATLFAMGDAEFSGLIGGSAGLVTHANGTLTLSNVGNEAAATGGVVVERGVLAVASDDALPAGAISLAGGATLRATADTTVDNAIVLDGDAALDATTASTLSGPISGLGGLTKLGVGTLTLNAANSYAGTTVVNAGVLRVLDEAALGSTAAGTTVAAGAAGAFSGDELSLSEDFTISGDGVGLGGALRVEVGHTTLAGGITLAADARIGADNSATLTVDGIIADGAGTSGLRVHNADTGRTVLNAANTYGGGTSTHGGFLRITNSDAFGDPTATATLDILENSSVELVGGLSIPTSKTWSLSGDGADGGAKLVSLSGDNAVLGPVGLVATQGINVAAGSLTVVGVIGGAAGLSKTGAGTLTLAGINTYTGPTSVGGGVLALSGGQALADASDVAVADGAALRLLAYEAIGGLGGGGAVELGPNTLTVNGASPSTYSGVISGTGGLTKADAGTLTLAGVNTYTGATTVNAGILALSGGQALADASAVAVADGAGLDVLAAETIGPLAGDGSVNLAGGPLSIGSDGTDTTFSGSILGVGGLTKVGAGTLTLEGGNDYTGATVIYGGTLVVNGSIADSSNLQVNPGATLGGLGRVPSLAVAAGGTVAPGNSPEALTGDAATFAAGSTFDVEIEGPIPGVEYDQLIALGAVDLGGATLALSLGDDFTPAVGDTFIIVQNEGIAAVAGTFAGLAEGAFVEAGGVTFRISYAGGDGNDVTLTASAATTTAVASSANPAVYGDAVMITVTVAAGLDVTPMGDVTLLIDGVAFGTMALNGLGTATFIVTGLAPGTHTIDAEYAGQGGFVASGGTLANGQQVGQAPTASTVSSSLNPSTFGQAVTFTAVVTGPAVGTPTGLVAFFDGDRPLGTVALVNGAASVTVDGLGVGGHVITARYLGDAIFQVTSTAAIIQGVDHAAVALTASPDTTATLVGQPVTFALRASAVAPGAGTPGGLVEVLVDGVLRQRVALGADGRAAVALAFDGVGTFAVAFRYLGDGNFVAGATTTAPVAVAPGPVIPTPPVVPAATVTSLNALSASTPVGRPVTFIAAVAVAGRGADRPSGVVTFLDGDAVLGTAALVDGQASLTVPGLPYGVHSIRAVYGGSADHEGSSSLAFAQRATVTMSDYDGDGIADLALYEYLPALGSGRFDVLLSSGGTLSAAIGDATALPVVGDFDGDGLCDIAVFSPSGLAATWTIVRSADGRREVVAFGAPGLTDVPAPADYDGDGRADLATFRRDSDLVAGAAQWFLLPTARGGAASMIGLGVAGSIGAPGDYDGDGRADLAVFDRALGQWRIRSLAASDAIETTYGQRGGGPVPVQSSLADRLGAFVGNDGPADVDDSSAIDAALADLGVFDSDEA